MVLAYRALGLGDLLTGLPALRALSDAFPGHRRVLATPAWLAPLARLSGSVDSVVDCGPLQPLPGCLASPDVAANLHGRGPQSHRVVRAARPRRTIAFACAGIEATTRGPRWRADEHEVVRWCRLLEESGIPADPSRLGLERPQGVPPLARGATVVHPGAASEARRWPAERFAAIARAEAATGRRVLVTGSAAEMPLAQCVARLAGLPPESVLAGRTNPLQLAAVVADAARVVCGDTGVAHLATAFDTPSVVVCGPIPPALWGPPADRPRHVALWAGRRGDPHADVPDPGLLAVGVDQVLAALAWLERAETAVA